MTTALAAVALVLGIARLAMFIALHLVPSDYNIVQHAVSDYAVGPRPAGSRPPSPGPRRCSGPYSQAPSPSGHRRRRRAWHSG